MQQHTAVIGLGAMGAAVARRLLDQGHRVTVWNRTAARATALVEAGAVLAPTPAEAGRGAAAVIVAVTDPAALREVTEGPEGLAAGVAPGTVVLQLSTVSPAAVASLAEVLPPGAELLDAPVLGSGAEAATGKLRLLVGGPAETYARSLPLLAVLGTPLHTGPLGTGTAAKLVANNAMFGVLGLLGESLALGSALGLPPEALYEVLAVTPLAEQAARRRPAIEAGTYPPRFALPLARKDADLVAEAAGAAGLGLPLTETTRAWLATAEAAGHADRDYTAVLAHIIHSTSEARP
ncbi:3-hydroxyisobutyrate dehydrogenase [Kitasatospora sp. MMS16-BH015]|uniref:NAD(P)-dependent oxidoreductase n=1 Tax=Kitasatospora sp. MMS16-BH015 TaxID=2018025 RepID=UPI000CA30140|nr:NAD(P)-dependent oxidoreductase [Kitasatospora sp. MMS16-BH015]AUG82198.1 3-hydroxyisobutyrate dehydrogenase [Kitasatospora sp. MMS16-BH015]